jgi:hypothetical protein
VTTKRFFSTCSIPTTWARTAKLACGVFMEPHRISFRDEGARPRSSVRAAAPPRRRSRCSLWRCRSRVRARLLRGGARCNRRRTTARSCFVEWSSAPGDSQRIRWCSVS